MLNMHDWSHAGIRSGTRVGSKLRAIQSPLQRLVYIQGYPGEV